MENVGDISSCRVAVLVVSYNLFSTVSVFASSPSGYASSIGASCPETDRGARETNSWRRLGCGKCPKTTSRESKLSSEPQETRSGLGDKLSQ